MPGAASRLLLTGSGTAALAGPADVYSVKATLPDDRTSYGWSRQASEEGGVAARRG